MGRQHDPLNVLETPINSPIGHRHRNGRSSIPDRKLKMDGTPLRLSGAVGDTIGLVRTENSNMSVAERKASALKAIRSRSAPGKH